MKLTSLIFLSACLVATTRTTAQTITLSAKEVSIEKAFAVVRQQSGVQVVYTNSMIKDAPKVTVELHAANLETAMNAILQNQNLSFSIVNNTIVIKEKSNDDKNPSDSSKLNSQPPPLVIRGTITDSTLHPLPGASVVLRHKGKAKVYTFTGEKGDFVLEAEKDDQLTFSYVGFEPREMMISDAQPIEVMLKRKYGQMEPAFVRVVNTGYQRIRPEQSTGAVSQIATKEYETPISTIFLPGLVNKLPGLVINNSLFQGINNSLFNIRGISTILGSQNPLIVVDGYPTELSLDMIDPNEIKSVTVLKDAAAATVYGVRASNGVIIIERKQAEQGKPRFSFRVTSGFTPKENYGRYRWAPDPATINANYLRTRYGTILNSASFGAFSTRNAYASSTPILYLLARQAAGLITPYQANKTIAALDGYNNAKDYNRLLLRTANTQTYHLDISGGSANILYYITANYIRNNLAQLNNSNNHVLLSGRNTLNFSGHLSLEMTIDYQQEHYHAAPVPDINTLYPFEQLQDLDGNPLSVANGSGVNSYFNSALVAQGLEDARYYPLVDLHEVSDKTHTANARVTANFKYKIGEGFYLTWGGMYETSHTDLQHYASPNSSEARQYVDTYASKDSNGSIIFNIPRGGFLQQQTARTSSYTARAQLNYNKHIGQDHRLNGILGAEMRDIIIKSGSTAYFGVGNQILPQPLTFTSKTDLNFKGSFAPIRQIIYDNLFYQQYKDNRYLSGYSNIVYAFRNTYSLSGSIRIDQSNLFGTNPKYKYKPFWSVGAAWNIDREKFLLKAAWIQGLKLRTAYGFNGNVAKMSLPQVIARPYISYFSNPTSTALDLSSYANSSLRWEQTRHFNAGLDYAIFKRISGSFDYYTKRSTDLLASTQIDPTIGLSPALINSASINNQGFEIGLHADWISKARFNWYTGLVLSRNTSKVLKVYQNLSFWPPALNRAGYVQGYPVGAIFAYRWAGIDSAGNARVTYEKGTTNSVSNSFSIGNSASSIQGDSLGIIRYMGPSTPTISAGLSNRIDIGNFYFYCLINYYGGFKVQVPRPDPSAVKPLNGAGNFWKQPGDEKHTDVISIAAFRTASYYVYNNADKYVVNGDYITLGVITASYSFNNSRFIKQIGFTHFEVKLQATNVYTIGLNKYNYSLATGSYAKSYLTPTYTIGLFTNF